MKTKYQCATIADGCPNCWRVILDVEAAARFTEFDYKIAELIGRPQFKFRAGDVVDVYGFSGEALAKEIDTRAALALLSEGK